MGLRDNAGGVVMVVVVVVVVVVRGWSFILGVAGNGSTQGQ